MAHIYVVGCGHSGTSLLKRTIGNLPGLRCLPKETWLFEHLKGKPPQLKKKLRLWDKKAAEGGFSGWVEKTPKHITYLADIFKYDPAARVVLIVRDGRDVAASLAARGFPWATCMGRWVLDNSAAVPYLDHPQLLTVRFEDFFDPDKVLGLLRQLSAFVGASAPTERLLLALQPPTTLLTDDEQCVAYDNEADKIADLADSYMQQMAAGEGIGAAAAAAVAGKGEAPKPRDHKRLRAWQSSQAWAPQRPGGWQQRLTAEQQQEMAGNKEMQELLQRFGYLDDNRDAS